MKASDLGFFARHAEKLVLGLGIFVLAAIAVTQFVFAPNAVEINNRTVTPGELTETVTQEATRLKANLDKPTFVPPIEIPQYTDTFTKLKELPVASENPWQGLLARTGVTVAQATPTEVLYPEKFLPRPPVPADIIVKSGHGVLTDTADQTFVSIREIIGEQIPADFPYVSVSTEFPFNQWKARLEAPNATAEERIDPGLWQRRMAITAVTLLREELDPVTGKWVNPTRIKPLPGQYAILPTDTTERTLQDAEAFETEIRASQQAIRLPPFPEIDNGPWSPPDYTDRVLNPEELARTAELSKDIANLQRQIKRLAGGDGRDGTPRRIAPDPMMPEEYMDPEGMGDPRRQRGRRTPRQPDPDRQPDQTEADRDALRLAKIQEELAVKQAEYNKLLGIEDADLLAQQPDYGGEYDPSMYPEGMTQPSFGQPNMNNPYANENFGGDALAAGEVPDRVKVWAHDLTVEPGKTYRYKVVVSVLNPLYRQSRLPTAQVADNFHRISLGPDEQELADAAWSAPITLDPAFLFFIVSANKDQKRIEAEVWTIYNGLWRRHSFTEHPGNGIGGLASIPGVDDGGLGIRMEVPSILLDVDSVSGAGVGGGGSAIRALFLDQTTGRIDSRLAEQDKRSEQRQRLINEEQAQAATQVTQNN